MPPVQPPVPQENPSNQYKLTFDNGSRLDVYIFASGKICTDYIDSVGTLLEINTFSDITQFKSYITTIKTSIEQSMKILDEVKNVLDEFGFEEIKIG